MPNEAETTTGQGNTGAGTQSTGDSLLGAPAGGGAANTGVKPETKPAGDSLLGDTGKKEGETKPAEGQKAEEKKGDEKPAAPEKYEFKAPEGITLDTALVEKATPIFKELGLSQDAAQKLVDFQAAQQMEANKAFQEQIQKWQSEVKAIPESDKVLGDAKLALDKLADPATQAMIGASWMGSHPGIIKLLAAAGKMLREDPLHEGRAAAPSAPADPASAMFGDMFKTK